MGFMTFIVNGPVGGQRLGSLQSYLSVAFQLFSTICPISKSSSYKGLPYAHINMTLLYWLGLPNGIYLQLVT